MSPRLKISFVAEANISGSDELICVLAARNLALSCIHRQEKS